LTGGYSSLEDFLASFWEGFFLPKDANDLWPCCGPGSTGHWQDPRFRRGLRAGAWRNPGQGDPQGLGHFAGGGIDTNQTDTRFIDDALRELLAQEM